MSISDQTAPRSEAIAVVLPRKFSYVLGEGVISQGRQGTLAWMRAAASRNRLVRSPKAVTGEGKRGRGRDLVRLAAEKVSRARCLFARSDLTL